MGSPNGTSVSSSSELTLFIRPTELPAGLLAAKPGYVSVCRGKSFYIYNCRSQDLFVLNLDSVFYRRLYFHGVVPPPLDGATMLLFGKSSICLFGGRMLMSGRKTNSMFVLELTTLLWTSYEIPGTGSRGPVVSAVYIPSRNEVSEISFPPGFQSFTTNTPSERFAACEAEGVLYMLYVKTSICAELWSFCLGTREMRFCCASPIGSSLVVCDRQLRLVLKTGEIRVWNGTSWALMGGEKPSPLWNPKMGTIVGLGDHIVMLQHIERLYLQQFPKYWIRSTNGWERLEAEGNMQLSSLFCSCSAPFPPQHHLLGFNDNNKAMLYTIALGRKGRHSLFATPTTGVYDMWKGKEFARDILEIDYTSYNASYNDPFCDDKRAVSSPGSQVSPSARSSIVMPGSLPSVEVTENTHPHNGKVSENPRNTCPGIRLDSRE